MPLPEHTTSLLREIRKKRASERAKRPMVFSTFDRISAIVSKYRLDKGFLKELADSRRFPFRTFPGPHHVKLKERLELPLFSLAGEEDYFIARAIVEITNNAYLEHVSSPEEVLLCASLFDLNPSLGSDALQRFHYETLLIYELARRGVVEMVRELEDLQPVCEQIRDLHDFRASVRKAQTEGRGTKQ